MNGPYPARFDEILDVSVSDIYLLSSLRRSRAERIRDGALVVHAQVIFRNLWCLLGVG